MHGAPGRTVRGTVVSCPSARPRRGRVRAHDPGRARHRPGHDGYDRALDPPRVNPGGVVVITGHQIATDEPVVVSLAGPTGRLGTAVTDGQGHSPSDPRSQPETRSVIPASRSADASRRLHEHQPAGRRVADLRWQRRAGGADEGLPGCRRSRPGSMGDPAPRTSSPPPRHPTSISSCSWRSRWRSGRSGSSCCARAVRPRPDRIDRVALASGRDPELASALAKLPDKPGVYLMKDARGEAVYVGKAQSLRHRVRSLAEEHHPAARRAPDPGRHRPDRRRRGHADRLGVGGAPPRGEPDQALPAALQRPPQGRQELPVHQGDARRRLPSDRANAQARQRRQPLLGPYASASSVDDR